MKKGIVKAVFFDQDGVIIDTERDGHRVAFNAAFNKFGIDAHWDIETYHELLQVGGGKERMRHYFRRNGILADLDNEAFDSRILEIHRYKTDLLITMLENEALPLRPGIHRTMLRANELGLILGICTTSNEKTARTISSKLLKDIDFDFIIAGDMVSRKKPDPEIYLMALEQAEIEPGQAIVFEDSRIGTLAAKRAGLNVVATVNAYTRDEDMSSADLVLSCLGDENEAAEVIRPDGAVSGENGILLDDLIAFFQK